MFLTNSYYDFNYHQNVFNYLNNQNNNCNFIKINIYKCFFKDLIVFNL